MELFTALLTGFFLWLWGYHWQRSRRARACEVAGPLLLEVKAASRIVRTLFCASIRRDNLAGIHADACGSLGSSGHVHEPRLSIFGKHVVLFHSAIFRSCSHVFILFALIMPPYRSGVVLEAREHGILFGNRRQWFRFRPSNEITECRWFLPKSVLGVSLCWRIPKLYKHSRLTILEKRIARGQKDAVTAVLSRFVPVYDRDGTLLARPSEADAAALAARPALGRSRFMFQFNLQSLLLLTVVVSCGASCYGIHLHRTEPMRLAIAFLAAFQPSLTDFGGPPIMLDFSKCANKPTDSDLAYLEPFDELWMLDLSATPITDAGLMHLMGLKHLDYIALNNTGVTSKGAEELSRALPAADIFYGPSKRVRMFGPSNRPGTAPPAGGK